MALNNIIESGAQTDVERSYDPVEGTPWENLGYPIPKNASVPEMLTAAQLDWKVLRARSVLQVEGEDGTTRPIANPKSFGLVRSTDYHILSPFVGPRYKVIQNDVAFGVFDEFIKAGQMTMETAGSLAGGSHIWGLARTGHGFELASGERIESYFLLLQSHLYGYALKAMWTPIRFPGGHSLVQTISRSGLGGRQTYTMSHASKFDEKRVQEIKEVMEIAEKSMEEFKGKAEFMSRMRVNPEDAIRYLINVFDTALPGRCEVAGENLPRTFAEIQGCSLANRNLKKIGKMLDRKYRDGEGTAWGCWSAVQHAYDHELGHGDSTRLENNWLGKNRDAKLQAFDLAEVLAAQKGK